jgi:hypothetical protein
MRALMTSADWLVSWLLLPSVCGLGMRLLISLKLWLTTSLILIWATTSPGKMTTSPGRTMTSPGRTMTSQGRMTVLNRDIDPFGLVRFQQASLQSRLLSCTLSLTPQQRRR